MKRTRTAIVTGAGQGIGFEICRQLVGKGVNVVLNDANAGLANDAAKEINEAAGSDGGRCVAIGGDASEIDFIHSLVERAVTVFGSLDIAIANAGITLFGDFLSYQPDSFQRVMEVNLRGSFFLAQAAALQMKLQGAGGSILFMSSVTGHQAHKQLAAYGMSKAALEMLAKNLVAELSPYQITVNTVAPGATLTQRTTGDSDYERTWSRITPLGRPASPSDIAHAALFLVSAEARHITGQTLIVDGGWTNISPGPY